MKKCYFVLTSTHEQVSRYCEESTSNDVDIISSNISEIFEKFNWKQSLYFMHQSTQAIVGNSWLTLHQPKKNFRVMIIFICSNSKVRYKAYIFHAWSITTIQYIKSNIKHKSTSSDVRKSDYFSHFIVDFFRCRVLIHGTQYLKRFLLKSILLIFLLLSIHTCFIREFLPSTPNVSKCAWYLLLLSFSACQSNYNRN